MKIEAQTLLLLSAIVETGSFAAAAARLGTSQPAVSREVKVLEARLGQRLFDRSVRPATPSPLCIDLAESGRGVAHATEQARLRLESNQSGDSGQLRLAGPPFFMDYVITPLIAVFLRSRPGVQVTVQQAYPGEAYTLVRRGRVDLALCPVEPIDLDAGIIFTPLLPARNVVATRTGHPLMRRQNLGLPDVLGHPWIAPAEGSPLWQDMQTTLLHLGAERVEIALRSTSPAGVLNYLVGSNALAILPAEVVRAMARYGVVELPISLPAPARTIGLLSRVPEEQGRLVRRAIADIADTFRRLKSERDAKPGPPPAP